MVVNKITTIAITAAVISILGQSPSSAQYGRSPGMPGTPSSAIPTTTSVTTNGMPAGYDAEMKKQAEAAQKRAAQEQAAREAEMAKQQEEMARRAREMQDRANRNGGPCAHITPRLECCRDAINKETGMPFCDTRDCKELNQKPKASSITEEID